MSDDLLFRKLDRLCAEACYKYNHRKADAFGSTLGIMVGA